MNTARKLSELTDYQRLVEMEPAIEAIITSATADMKKRRKWEVYEIAKRRLAFHVGWGARLQSLADEHSWNTALKELSARMGI